MKTLKLKHIESGALRYKRVENNFPVQVGDFLKYKSYTINQNKNLIIGINTKESRKAEKQKREAEEEKREMEKIEKKRETEEEIRNRHLGVMGNEYRYMMRQVFASYINSKEWKALVKAVRLRDFDQCQDCGELRGKLIVHHTDYRNWGYGDLREMNDCILVCEKCHNKRHRNYSVDVPFWANRKDEIPPELYFDNAREEMRRLHPMNKLRKRKLI